jgi:hypothetical protein
MSARSGFASTLTLSYDFVFLTVVQLGLDGRKLTAEKKRCPLHPIRKTPCVSCKDSTGISVGEFEYSADAAVILTYHKLRDDLHDKGIGSRLAAAALIPFYRKPYKAAAKRYPYLAQSVENAMTEQSRLERDGCRSVDMACEPTAQMMKAVFRETGGNDPDMRELMGRFGYLLGRYVYICDALDDLLDDFKQGNFNPLISKKPTDKNRGREVPDEKSVNNAMRTAEQSVNFTLGELSDVYVKLGLGDMQPITDNIIYLGLKNTFKSVKNKCKNNINNINNKTKER